MTFREKECLETSKHFDEWIHKDKEGISNAMGQSVLKNQLLHLPGNTDFVAVFEGHLNQAAVFNPKEPEIQTSSRRDRNTPGRRENVVYLSWERGIDTGLTGWLLSRGRRERRGWA